MSLYNQLFQEDPISSTLLGYLDIDKREIPRYRDCYLNETGTRIVVLTRTGSSDYDNDNADVEHLEWFDKTEVDKNDSTYRYFYFLIPDENKEDVRALINAGNCKTPAIDRFMELVNKLGDDSMQDDPEVIRAKEVGKKIMEQITEKMENPSDDGSPPIIEV